MSDSSRLGPMQVPQPVPSKEPYSFTPGTDILIAVMVRVHLEMSRSFNEKGYMTTDTLRATALIEEEAGEAIKAALDYTRAGGNTLENRRHLRTEITQTVSIALHVLCSMEMQDQKMARLSQLASTHEPKRSLIHAELEEQAEDPTLPAKPQENGDE